MSTLNRVSFVKSRRSWQGSQLGLHIAVVFLLLVSLVPVYLLLVVSFKNPLQYQHDRWVVTLPLRIRNYAAAWEQISLYMRNTFLVAVVGFVGRAVLSTIGGYVFARMRFPFRNQIYAAIIALLIVPWSISFVPAYMVYAHFGLDDTFWALTLPRIVGGSVFGIFLLRTFFERLPEELFEAARIDGAGIFDLIVRIALPLSASTIATLGILDFIQAWNDFLWPFVATRSESLRVISVGLYLLRSDTAGAGWGSLFAGYVISSVPLAILFFALGKFYVEGLVESGMKA